MAAVSIGLGSILIKSLIGAAATAGAGALINKVNWEEIGKKLEDGWEALKKGKKLENAIKGNETLNQEEAKELGFAESIPPEQEKGQPENKNQTPNVIPNISDTTNENIETPSGNGFNIQEYLQQFEKRQEELMRLQMEREDTAYSRAIADIRRSGANPNLMGSIQPADSNAISNMANMNADELTEILSGYMSLVEQEIQNNWQGDENSKKNFMQSFGTILAGLFLIASKGKL